MAVTGKYALVLLGSVYFTRNGLVGGAHCKTEIGGLEALATTGGVQAILALSGKPYLQLSEDQLGKPISISCTQLEQTVYEDVVDEIQDAIDNSTTIELDITDSPYGTFNLTVLPDANPIRHSHEFQNTSLKEVSFHFLTT